MHLRIVEKLERLSTSGLDNNPTRFAVQKRYGADSWMDISGLVTLYAARQIIQNGGLERVVT